MNKEKRRVPKLRFPGFTEDWEQRKLGSIGSTYAGLSGKTKEDFGHGEAQYITYLNVFQNTVSNITMTDKVEIDITQNEVKYGDVLFTTSSETPEEVGMSSVWLGHTPNIYLNSFCFGFRPNQKIDPYFLGYSLRAPYMRDKIKILAQGISRYNISKNKVMELEISLPNNEEQSLLGNFLRNIDLGITLHQRKLEHLNLKKKALLQKLFPKNGERYPELRFPGFTDAWEQRKLSDITEIVMGQSPSSKNYTDNPNDNILVQGNADLKDGKVVPRLWTKEITKTIDKDGIILTVRAPVGDVARTDYKVVLGRGVAGIKGNDYIYQFLQKLQNNRYWVSLSSGSTFESINSNDIKDLIIDIPSIEEQTKISMLLNNVNSIITLHQRKLDHLQLQKKALLQQMFV